jgi:hypothetical protein
MKKVYLLIAMCTVAFSIAAQDLVIPKLANEPVIDGQVDAIWDLIDPVNLEFEPEDDFGPATIFEGWFKLAWNDSTLFLLMRRDDDDFADQWTTQLEDWKSDRDEIFIDINVDTLADGRGASDAQSGASYGHYQFTSLWVQDETEWTGNPSQWYHNAPFTFGYYFDTENSYYTEYAFPFSSLTIDTDLLPTADETFQGAEGVVFGFLPVIADVDMADSPTDETFRKFLKWVDEGGWDTMDDAGHVELGANVISSIEESFGKSNITAYPSPARDYFQLANLTQSVSVTVFDVVGNLIMTHDNVNSDSRIDLSSLQKGLYLIVVDDEVAIKLVKE